MDVDGDSRPLLPHMQQSTLSVASSAGLFAIAAPDPVAQPAAAAAGTLLQPPPLDASDFDLLHQCVRVELDFEREHLRGSNEMRLRVARGSTEVRLNASSQLRLLAISLDGAPLELSAASIARSTDDVVPRDKRRTRDLGSFRACHGAAVFASQDGELTIPLPPRLLAEAAARRDDDDPYAAADAAAADGDGGVEVTLIIEYEVVKPDGGVAFVRGGGGGASYAVTVGEEGSARRWFPCVDRLETRCEATLHVTVRAGLTVFGSGRPIGTTTTGDGTRDAKTTFSFSHEFFDGGPPRGAPQPDGTPTCAVRASQLGFVAGNLASVDHPTLPGVHLVLGVSDADADGARAELWPKLFNAARLLPSLFSFLRRFFRGTAGAGGAPAAAAAAAATAADTRGVRVVPSSGARQVGHVCDCSSQARRQR